MKQSHQILVLGLYSFSPTAATNPQNSVRGKDSFDKVHCLAGSSLKLFNKFITTIRLKVLLKFWNFSHLSSINLNRDCVNFNLMSSSIFLISCKFVVLSFYVLNLK